MSTGGPKVYDITKYLDEHPGGSDVMLEVAGKDADDMFEATGHSQEAREIMKKYLIGTLKVSFIVIIISVPISTFITTSHTHIHTHINTHIHTYAHTHTKIHNYHHTP
ncbi:cytochrome b5 domain-containing protein [archaeon]|nr:MAG: cytochrome b5 domain-containing protein [archaeon]